MTGCRRARPWTAARGRANDANAAPMSAVFTTTPDLRPYDAIIPGVLCQSPVDLTLVPACADPGQTVTQALAPRHDGAWWAAGTRGMDFSRPDRIDPARFNALLAQDYPR